MAKAAHLRVVESPPSSYLSDDEICDDLDVSQMTLVRLRRRGDYPKPIKFTPGGRNRTPREEHEKFKAARATAPREISEAKREGGLKLAARRAKKLTEVRQTERGEIPGRDPDRSQHLDLEDAIAAASAAAADTAKL
jgi:hypothetical protein